MPNCPSKNPDTPLIRHAAASAPASRRMVSALPAATATTAGLSSSRTERNAVPEVGSGRPAARSAFASAPTDRLWLPGPYDRPRFQGLELAPGRGIRGVGDPEVSADQIGVFVAEAAIRAGQPARSAEIEKHRAAADERLNVPGN